MSRTLTAQLTRPTYRHEDLGRELLEAALTLAREGGAEAVAWREVTRRVGVVPNAAYRHFASHAQLLQAVRAEALAAVACSMEHELATVPQLGARAKKSGPAAIAHARACLRAVGRGYLKFAWDEPGLFQIAFLRPIETMPRSTDSAKVGRSGLNPFQLLGSALDGLVAAGVLPVARRAQAEYLAWAAVHGFALLVSEGPLHAMQRAQADVLAERLLDMVERGV